MNELKERLSDALKVDGGAQEDAFCALFKSDIKKLLCEYMKLLDVKIILESCEKGFVVNIVAVGDHLVDVGKIKQFY